MAHGHSRNYTTLTDATEILATCVVAPSIQYTPGRSIELKGQWPQEGSLASRLPEWMIRGDLNQYRSTALEAAGYNTESFGTPETAIRSYLFDLSANGSVVLWDRDAQAFFIEGELHGYLYRRHELRWKLQQILEAANAPQPEEITGRWLRKYNVGGCCPDSVARRGGEAYDALLFRIDNLRRMAHAYHEDYVVDDLCGLSLQSLRETRLAEKEQREAKRLRELANAVAARRRALETDAQQGLNEEAADWLSSSSPDDIKTILDWAAESDEQLRAAERQLGQAVRSRKAKLAALKAMDDCLRELELKVRAAISDPQRADLFLKAWSPTCDSPAAVKAILMKLPKRR